ncbi:hypothetical protein [Mucilaginibacter sp.]|uniref:DUF922 domain-containing protein n=1 Tax=Mucilaginibacter sp. TaxID=1882438 RepID=UPI00260B82DE|nr:hypothetical protein [Mucilaginibacter sp.]MDB4919999.1 hypothetical protein [Mucilaginibacter sp.]
MTSLNYTLKISYNCILLFVFIAFSGFQSSPKQIDNIVLADERLPITPKEFYIAKVIDERENRHAIALLMPIINIKGIQSKAYPVDLKGGTFLAIKQFINNSIPRNTALRPVIISLKKINISETAQAGNIVEGRIDVIFSFALDKGEDDMLHLADYNGKAVYNRDAGQTRDIEPTLRHVLTNGLLYINTWMNQQAETNIKLARGVKVMFTDYTEKPEGDSIYYNVKRPLTWADFQSKVPNSKYEAEVFPTLGYVEHAEIVNGIINLHLGIKACLPKSASWAKEGSRNNYTLNHEQRHFDIVKIAAEHFKQTIKARTLTTENYNGPINEEYLDAYREMNNLQKQYDDETHHGTNTTEQQKWNERIDKELKELGVKQ